MRERRVANLGIEQIPSGAIARDAAALHRAGAAQGAGAAHRAWPCEILPRRQLRDDQFAVLVTDSLYRPDGRAAVGRRGISGSRKPCHLTIVSFLVVRR